VAIDVVVLHDRKEEKGYESEGGEVGTADEEE